MPGPPTPAPVEVLGGGDTGGQPDDDVVAALFSPGVLHTVRLELRPEARAALAVPEVEVDVVVDLDEGWIRRRARLSLRGGAWATTPRLRLRMDADSAVGPLRRLVLDPQVRDPARLRAPLAAWVLADARVPAPRIVIARVYDGDVPLGVHAMSEEVDGAFALRRGLPPSRAWSASDGVDLVPEAVMAWELVGGGVAEGEAPSAPDEEDRSALSALAEACVAAGTPLAESLARDLPGWWNTWAWQLALGDAGTSPRVPEDLNLLEDDASGVLLPVPTDLGNAWDPAADARVARTQLGARCLREEACRAGLAARVDRVLGAWDEGAVLARLDALAGLDAGARSPEEARSVAEARATLRELVRDIPERVAGQVRGW